MRLKAFAATIGVATLGAGFLNLAADNPQDFNFDGFAIRGGGTLTVRSIVATLNAPIPLDGSLEHTLVLTGTLSNPGPPEEYSPATFEIWSDATTPADYGTPSTFADGDLILSGVFDGVLTRDPPLLGTAGTFGGRVDFTGGSRLGELSSPHDWDFVGTWDSDGPGIPDGYDETWNGKIDEPEPVSVEQKAWSGVKSLFQ